MDFQVSGKRAKTVTFWSHKSCYGLDLPPKQESIDNVGLAVGFWDNLEDLRQNWGMDRIWEPRMEASTREKLYNGWLRAVERTFDWIE